MPLHRLSLWTLTRQMPEQYEHHGLSGEYVMLPSGEMVPADEAATTKPVAPATTKTVQSAPKAQN